MSYAFHDITQFVEAYLDDLAAHSKKRVDHSAHLRAIFDQCWKYKIRLNPLKCSFCVIVGRLLGFIIFRHGIMFDPLKVEAILQLSPRALFVNFKACKGKLIFSDGSFPTMSRSRRPSCTFLRRKFPFTGMTRFRDILRL